MSNLLAAQKMVADLIVITTEGMEPDCQDHRFWNQMFWALILDFLLTCYVILHAGC